MPRGRPKKEPVEGGGGDVAAPLIQTPDDAAFSIEIPGGPPSKIKGEWNPDYFAAKILRAANLYEQATLIEGGKSDFNVESYTKWVLAAAKVCQIDERDVRDRRTTLQRAEDLYKSIKADANVLLEADDDDLLALDEVLAVKETRMNDADEMCKAYLKSGLDDLEEANARSPKSWRLRIKRILNLRMRARNPIPACSFRGNQRTETAAGADPYPGLIKAALEAAHPLRFMLYVGRSSMDTAKRFTRKRLISEADKVFLIGRHHAKMVCDTWEARNGVMFAIEDGMKVIKRGIIPYSGVMLVIPPGHGKPLDIETLVTMGDGSKKRLGDVSVGDYVIGHSGEPRRVTEVFEQGELPTIKMDTHSGRSVVSALDHSFLTPKGWFPAGQLKVDDHLALKSGFRTSSNENDNPDRYRLAGYFVGDGSTGKSGGNGINAKITCADPLQVAEFYRCAASLGFVIRATHDGKSKAMDYAFSTGTEGPRKWLREVGLSGKTSYTKRVPEFVFRGNDQCVSEFLAAYFECDGTVYKSPRSKNDLCVEFYSVNRDLLMDVSSLLLRLGIKMRVSEKNGRYKGRPHKSWRLTASSIDETYKFCERIPVRGVKGEKLKRLAIDRLCFDRTFESDRIVSITDNGLRPCRCLTVENDHTFLANDIVVHNTECMSHYDALEVCLRPNTMGVILHAVEDEASKILVYIQNLFKKDNPAGKRCGALFDRPLAKKGNNSFHFRLAGNHGKSATFRASGVMSARLGSDTTIQHLDDVVPQADAHEETERVKRCDVIAGTWATRQRGQNVFRIITCTLWHHADANMQIINQARLAARTNGQQGMIFRISIQKCGGPDKNPQKAFEPLWPEVYDRFELRSFYNNLKPRLYSAAYQSNPLSDEQKIVKKLRIYDPETPEHEAFIKSSVKYISLDPAATKESKSDKAGILYAGVGDVRVTREIDGIQTTDTETRVRFFFAHEIHATQSDLTEYVCGFALNKPVDYVLSEAVAGFKGIIEMFQNKGIDAIPLHPKGKSKESRLRGVAPLLEDASAELGFRAIAEFPGIRNERGELILHPMFNGLSEQILEFGVCADDHILDACTQLLGYVAPDVGVGRGVVSEQAKAQERVSRDPRLAAIVSRLMKGKDEEGGSVEREESQWISRNWQ